MQLDILYRAKETVILVKQIVYHVVQWLRVINVQLIILIMLIHNHVHILYVVQDNIIVNHQEHVPHATLDAVLVHLPMYVLIVLMDITYQMEPVLHVLIIAYNAQELINVLIALNITHLFKIHHYVFIANALIINTLTLILANVFLV